MANWPVIGHEWATELLAQAVRSGRVSHAYLFLGPDQVGKTTVAKAFARALVCERGDGGPCGESDACRSCRRTAEGRYPDVQIIAAEKNWIQIEQVRNLQADAAIAPLEGRRKVFVIREIERATLPAANALLKTLEEPPSQRRPVAHQQPPRPGAAHGALPLPDHRVAHPADRAGAGPRCRSAGAWQRIRRPCWRA